MKLKIVENLTAAILKTKFTGSAKKSLAFQIVNSVVLILIQINIKQLRKNKKK